MTLHATDERMAAVWRLQWKRVHWISQNSEVHPTCDLYRFMKKRGERRKQEGEIVMGLLSYKIIRSTCLGFSKQLQVIVTCDVLQQRLTTAAMGRSVLLESQTRAQRLIHASAKGCHHSFFIYGACDTHRVLIFLRNRVSLPPHLCHLFLIPQLSLCLGLEGW